MTSLAMSRYDTVKVTTGSYPLDTASSFPIAFTVCEKNANYGDPFSKSSSIYEALA